MDDLVNSEVQPTDILISFAAETSIVRSNIPPGFIGYLCNLAEDFNLVLNRGGQIVHNFCGLRLQHVADSKFGKMQKMRKNEEDAGNMLIVLKKGASDKIGEELSPMESYKRNLLCVDEKRKEQVDAAFYCTTFNLVYILTN